MQTKIFSNNLKNENIDNLTENDSKSVNSGFSMDSVLDTSSVEKIIEQEINFDRGPTLRF